MRILASRSGGTGHRRIWALGAGLLSLVTLIQVWPPPSGGAGSYQPFQLQRSSIPPGPVVITAVRTGLIWRTDSAPPTAVTVRNDSIGRADCRVWWLLSRRGDPKPWADAIAQSAQVGVQVAAQQSKTVDLSGPSMFLFPPGTFSLSAWVHCYRPATGALVPSDGATMGGAVDVRTASLSLEHSSSAPSLHWIDAVAAGRLVAGRPGQVRVTIANAWIEPVMVQVNCWLVPAEPATSNVHRGQIGSAPGLSGQSEVSDVNLSAVGLTAVNLVVPQLPAPGLYVLSVTTRLEQATSSVPADSVVVQPDVAVNA
jgi:hypothetical protein